MGDGGPDLVGWLIRFTVSGYCAPGARKFGGFLWRQVILRFFPFVHRPFGGMDRLGGGYFS